MSASNNNALIAPIYDKISLPHLLEAAVQKTYHEWNTVADVYVFHFCLIKIFFSFYFTQYIKFRTVDSQRNVIKLISFFMLMSKTELIKFARRARQLFIWILAVVRSAATSGKWLHVKQIFIDKLDGIRVSLDYEMRCEGWL